VPFKFNLRHYTSPAGMGKAMYDIFVERNLL
jgi:hypothetical protein